MSNQSLTRLHLSLTLERIRHSWGEIGVIDGIAPALDLLPQLTVICMDDEFEHGDVGALCDTLDAKRARTPSVLHHSIPSSPAGFDPRQQGL